MSSLIDKLRVKPIPKQKIPVNIGLARGEPELQQAVKLTTKIIDKREKYNKRRDIGQIRKRFAPTRVVAELVPETIIKPREPIRRLKIVEDEDDGEGVGNVNVDEERFDDDIISESIRKAEADAVATEEKVDAYADADAEEIKPKTIIKRPRLVIRDKTKKPENKPEPEPAIDTEPAKDTNADLEKGTKMVLPKHKKKLRVAEGPITQLRIGDTIMPDRLPEKKPEVLIRASSYYMSNREIFLNFISSLFRNYKEQIESESANVSCDQRQTGEYSAMAHQNLVRDYLNIYTPYRGLLLYHGLGSGKTCTSIGIAEGLKNHKQVMILTPASLRANFYKELKKCGDPLFRRNQFWEFINTRDARLGDAKRAKLIEAISTALSLPAGFIEKQGGAWLVNVKKPANYTSLTAPQQRQLDEQLNTMIENKYQFINYNGLRKSHLDTMTASSTVNPFDEKVVVIEEAHNFVSRIANKISSRATGSLAIRLYEYLLSAKNCKIVLLTGTPIINYPNELGIMFNILRGYIKTFVFKLNILSEQKVSEDTIRRILSGVSVVDYVEYSANRTTLTITKNPFGFVNNVRKGTGTGAGAAKYEGVMVGERGDIDDEGFIRIVTAALSKSDIQVAKGIQVREFKALPETLNDFKAYFIDEDGYSVKNVNLFKRRILGLTSYFRSAQETLMPSYNKSVDFHVEKVPMSNFQFGVYEDARKQERKLEKKNAQKRKKGQGQGGNIYEETVSTYRIFSRAFCNFVFPKDEIQRPLPIKGDDMQAALEGEVDEDFLDAKSVDEKMRNPDGIYGAEDREELAAIQKRLDAAEYETRIQDALAKLKEEAHKYLTPEALQTYSPKFLKMLQNITDADNVGCNLIYSQFRTLEGVGIFKLVLEQNGFAQFKLKKNSAGIWSLNMSAGDIDKPKFALYTGTEDDEEKELVRNIFNGEWGLVPRNLVNAMNEKGMTKNTLGETIKILMITASGAEGIDLKNVRYVHIVEPYWHPVRIEQVIGRARRICSHSALPEELRTVEVILYLMEFTPEQLSDEMSLELRLKDKSKMDNTTPFTSDQSIYEIATIKEDVNSQLLLAVKEASVDCVIHSKSGSKEGLKCYSFGSATSDKFATTPNISAEEGDAVAEANKVKITWKAKVVTVEGIKYALREDTGELFDLESFKAKNPVLVGNLEKKGSRFKVTWI